MTPRHLLFTLLSSIIYIFAASAATYAFTDLDEAHPHYLAVDFLNREGIYQGYPDGTFKAGDLVNRAELLKVLIEARDIYIRPDKYRNCFDDVNEEWFAHYVCYAKQQGWVEGYLDETFKPDQPVNKAEAMKIFDQIFQFPVASESVAFKDVTKSDWHEPYLSRALSTQVLRPKGEAYNPEEWMTRSDVAVHLFRAMRWRGQVPREFNSLLLVGEAGDAGPLFKLAARSFQAQNGGQIYEVFSGDETVDAFNEFKHEYVDLNHFEYFGHGDNKALYVSQHPTKYASFFTNTPESVADFPAASLYELDPEIFSAGATAQFNGCNIATGYPYTDTFAQKFANHFNVDVIAPTGPTEFTLDGKASVLLVPTYDERGFISVSPQTQSSTPYTDVKKGEPYAEAVSELYRRGLRLGTEEKRFKAYEYISYRDALEFCKAAASDDSLCELSEISLDEKLRNLFALKLIMKGLTIEVADSDPWYNPYINWAKARDALTQDFTSKTWYTRGEMAQLTWNILSKQ